MGTQHQSRHSCSQRKGLKTKEYKKKRKTGKDQEAMQGDGGISVKDHSL